MLDGVASSHQAFTSPAIGVLTQLVVNTNYTFLSASVWTWLQTGPSNTSGLRKTLPWCDKCCLLRPFALAAVSVEETSFEFDVAVISVYSRGNKRFTVSFQGRLHVSRFAKEWIRWHSTVYICPRLEYIETQLSSERFKQVWTRP